jgi:hypothetical protein
LNVNGVPGFLPPSGCPKTLRGVKAERGRLGCRPGNDAGPNARPEGIAEAANCSGGGLRRPVGRFDNYGLFL